MRDALIRLVDLLNQLSDVLQPFVTSHHAGDRVWNGQEYAPSPESGDGDPVASAWRATAFTAANLLTGQRTLTSEQHEFLQQQFFSGMGSLNDLSLDSARWGDKAAEANRQLAIIRPALYSCLHSLTSYAAQKT